MQVPDANGMIDSRQSVSQFSSMFRRKLGKNEAPYLVAVTNLNNDLVDEWEDKVLLEICHNGLIDANVIAPSMDVFYTGTTIGAYNDLVAQGLVTRVSEEVLDFWKDFFTKDVEELWEYGPFVVSHGWSLIKNELLFTIADAKYEAVYSTTNDPAEWHRLHNQYIHLFNGSKYPFWGKELMVQYSEKVMTVLRNQVELPKITVEEMDVKQFTKEFKRRHYINDKPYTNSTTILNNALIDTFVDEVVLKTDISFEGIVNVKKAMTAWEIFFEAFCIKPLQDLLAKGLISQFNDTQVTQWKDIFVNGSIEDIWSLGIPMVYYGWHGLEENIRIAIANMKWNIMYKPKDSDSDYDDLSAEGDFENTWFENMRPPAEWLDLFSENKTLFNGSYLPSWSIEDYGTAVEKMDCIMTNRLEPKH